MYVKLSITWDLPSYSDPSFESRYVGRDVQRRCRSCCVWMYGIAHTKCTQQHGGPYHDPISCSHHETRGARLALSLMALQLYRAAHAAGCTVC